MYYYCCCYFMSYNLYINIAFILLYPVVLKIYVTTGIGVSYFVLAFLYSFLLEKKTISKIMLADLQFSVYH